jgi:hypothetical protein
MRVWAVGGYPRMGLEQSPYRPGGGGLCVDFFELYGQKTQEWSERGDL